ncbi:MULTISPECIES: glycosyltransferase [unclassified Curtobacterium]|uniref:glycosyltransferase n=1 Tax=unclassified Curtobacterium TaxID=257496 RepID=UPI00382B23EC
MAVIGTRGYPSYYGGFETAVRRLAPYLNEAGWDVTVYGRRGSVVKSDPAADPTVVSKYTSGVNSKSLSTLTFGATASASALVRRPDVALVMNVANGFFLPALRARGIPTLVNVDGVEWDRAKWNRVAKAVFHAGAAMTARWADELVFDARAIGDRWKKEFDAEGTFIPYGADTHPLLPLEAGLEHRGYVLYVARFVPENSVNEFFAAAEVLAESWPVVIVGSDGFHGDFDTRARQLDTTTARVHWLGHVSDDERLTSLWQHAGVYFHGHSVGGTNPALVQAMANGAPTVARDTVYNRETLANTGVFTEPDPGSIVTAVSGLMRSGDAEQLSHDARERAMSDYSWDGVCQAYEAALSRLSNQKRS